MTEYKLTDVTGNENWQPAPLLLSVQDNKFEFDMNAYPFVAGHINTGDVVYATMKVRITNPND